jgi:putative hydrolase of the HAD superfamily
MRQLQLITFDLDNTLWPVEEVILRAERTSSRFLQEQFPEWQEQLSVPSLRAVRDQLVKDEQDYWKQLTRLRLDTLAQALTNLGLAYRDAQIAASQAFDVFYQERNRVNFFPHALTMLETLADRYILGALSNGNANLERIGINHLFRFHHSAESVGNAKPAAAIFNAALASAGVNARNAVHIGDHPQEDVDGARHAGFAAIWANLLDMEWPASLPPPTYRIHHLNELTDTLRLLND